MSLMIIAKVLFMLVVSFFILVTVTKLKSKELKQFGKLLAIAIWILSAFMVLNLLAMTMYGPGCKKSQKMTHARMNRGVMRGSALPSS